MFLKNNYKKLSAVIAALLLVFLSFSCVTTGGQEDAAALDQSGTNPAPMYYGYGTGNTSLEAITDARREAVRAAAEDLLGRASYKGQREEVEQLLAEVNDFTPFVRKESQQTLNSTSGDGYSYQLGIRIELSALAAFLQENDILGGQIDGRADMSYSLPDQSAPKLQTAEETGKAEVQTEKPAAEPVGTDAPREAQDISAEEMAVIRDYLDSLTYMVYYDETIEADPFLVRTAVTSANRYLENNSYEYVNLAQIEQIKDDQRLVYEEETGEAVSIIQWIAHKLNADIYIELTLTANSNTEDGRYYGSANVSLNTFNASTAEGLGSAAYQTNPPAFSTVSESDALVNAVSSAVFKAMNAAVEKAENETAVAAAKGFKYSLNMMNTSDSKTLRDFEKKLSKRVKDLKRISFSPEESVFEVYLIGDISDLEDLVYDTAETIPGMEGLFLVMQRRSSITFDTGL